MSEKERDRVVGSALEEAIAMELVDYMHDVAIGSFNATNSARRAARMIAAMLKPGAYLDRLIERSRFPPNTEASC